MPFQKFKQLKGRAFSTGFATDRISQFIWVFYNYDYYTKDSHMINKLFRDFCKNKLSTDK